MSSGASGGVSVKAGPSPKVGGRSALRRAQRRAMVRQSRATDDPEVPAMACARVCADCGQLGWPRQASMASPHRYDADSGPRLEACSHCHAEAWIDLSRESTALALRTGEQESRTFRASAAAGIPAMVGMIAGVLAGLYFFYATPFAELLGVVSGVVGMTAGFGIGALAQRRGIPNATALPHRWSMALPPAASAAPRRIEGPVSATGEGLQSPISGRPCVAYEIGLRADDRADGALGMWELLEQRVAASRVQEVDLEPARTHLSLPRVKIGQLTAGQLDDAALAYFRQRGYTPEGSTLWVYEAVVEEGARVVVETSDGGAVLRSATQALAVNEA